MLVESLHPALREEVGALLVAFAPFRDMGTFKVVAFKLSTPGNGLILSL